MRCPRISKQPARQREPSSSRGSDLASKCRPDHDVNICGSRVPCILAWILHHATDASWLSGVRRLEPMRRRRRRHRKDLARECQTTHVDLTVKGGANWRAKGKSSTASCSGSTHRFTMVRELSAERLPALPTVASSNRLETQAKADEWQLASSHSRPLNRTRNLQMSTCIDEAPPTLCHVMMGTKSMSGGHNSQPCPLKYSLTQEYRYCANISQWPTPPTPHATQVVEPLRCFKSCNGRKLRCHPSRARAPSRRRCTPRASCTRGHGGRSRGAGRCA